MSQLRACADKLLAQDSGTDLRQYLDAYHHLLWAIVTADRAELSDLIGLLYQEPYINLPVPLQVAAFRLWGLEPPDDPERLQAALAGVALYCSPGDEFRACAGLKARQQLLASGGRA